MTIRTDFEFCPDCGKPEGEGHRHDPDCVRLLSEDGIAEKMVRLTIAQTKEGKPMTKPNGGPAFPYSALELDANTRQLVGSIYADSRGMTLRDYFAGLAIMGICPGSGLTNPEVAQYAAWAYRMSDAMLAEREKP